MAVPVFFVDGAVLTAGQLNQNNTYLDAKVIGVTQGGTGVDVSAAGNGKLLIGNGSGMSLANLTPDAGITITNTSGGITIGASSVSLASDAVTYTTADVTTASTSLTDLTGATLTLNTGARRVLLTFTASVSISVAPNSLTFNFDADGIAQLGTSGANVNVATTNSEVHVVSMSFLTAVQTSASHTFKVRWKVSGATGTVKGSTANAYHFSACEMPAG